MAAPTAPTISTLAAEALKKAGETNPSAALTTRAEDLWPEEIKNDIWTRSKTLKSLQTLGVVTLTRGLSRYSMPTDFAGQGEISMRLVYGASTGVLQDGAEGSVTLAADLSKDEAWMIGKEIVITSGTGINQISQITAWNNMTKVATISPNWGTTPVAADGYMVVESYRLLEEGPIWNYDKSFGQMTPGLPYYFHPTGDADYSEFYLDPVPDNTYTYAVIIRYYANIMTLDLAGTLMATLYQKYRNVWLYGIMAKKLADDDDNRAGTFQATYENALGRMIAAENYGMSFNNLQAVVEK